MWAASLANSSGSAEYPGEAMQVRMMTDKTPGTRMARDYSTEIARALSEHISTNLSSCFLSRLSVESRRSAASRGPQKKVLLAQSTSKSFVAAVHFINA